MECKEIRVFSLQHAVAMQSTTNSYTIATRGDSNIPWCGPYRQLKSIVWLSNSWPH